MKPYNHKAIEKKWQKEWTKKKLFKTAEKSTKPKCYVLDMFPYPSGAGLHVGHPKGYIATDIYARYKRMNGFNVLHPMGWDAFGLPAENYAIANKINPRIATAQNVKRYKKQIEILGLSYDWSREIDTTDPTFYKWTQWAFIQMFKKGLAYESYEPVNWCPKDKTVLANEDVEDGKCERCGTPVEKKPMRQWVLKITKYADRLLEDLGGLQWPEHIKDAQRNWIGRSEGAELEFTVKNNSETIKVFTTRPDTLFGVTYVVLAPEHILISTLKNQISNSKEVEKYVADIKQKTVIERTAEGKEKTGIELKGIKAINPANGEEVPVWIADYVLADYGTGAVMAVPAHDERDYAFAKKYNLPIKKVIEPVFTQSVEPGKVKEGLPFEHRDAIIAIVKHWSEDTYIGLKWKQVAWGTFITGGIEKGQTPEEAARMEIREETGFLNLKLLSDFGILHGKFYHVPKQVNRFAHSQTLFFKLENNERAVVDSSELEKHELVWLTKEELAKFLTADSHLHALEILNGKEVYPGNGVLVNSGKFDGKNSEEVKKSIAEFAGGKMTVTYKLKDWVFSRQRYWGEPIPMIHCEKCGVVPVPEKDLPVKLPNVKSYEPTGTGESPLAAIKKWVNVKCPVCKSPAKRETNTMPQWAGSSWYYLRFIDPKNTKALVDKEKEKYWSPVDMYIGGTEHAARHLIYARFWHKFLFDIGAVNYSEPFARMGKSLGLIMGADGRKMSKRWGNVVNPDDMVNQYGADTLRVYEMFMGPFENAIAWNTESMIGSRRFLDRVWRLAERVTKNDTTTPTENKTIEAAIHNTIKKVTENIEEFSFNTSISAMMILLNALEKEEKISRTWLEMFLKILSPFAPHITDELWNGLGNKKSVSAEQWPVFDPKKLSTGTVKIMIQINGKMRDEIDVPESEIEEKQVTEAVLKREKVQKWMGGGTPKKIIYVKGRVVNIVV